MKSISGSLIQENFKNYLLAKIVYCVDETSAVLDEPSKQTPAKTSMAKILQSVMLWHCLAQITGLSVDTVANGNCIVVPV